MRQIGLYVDISSLFNCVRTKYKLRLDYAKLLEYVKGFGDIHTARAYGMQSGDEAVGFRYCLKKLGYNTLYKSYYPNRNIGWNLDIAMDIVTNLESYDIIFLGSANKSLIPLVKYCTDKDKRVIILASNIPPTLGDIATTAVEIPESMLETSDPN